ncbi:Fic family protein [Arthrobacter sp. H35-D1]|uniref:Fic/DOC family protein n=1 Tax=Arthrobacter sp. H35-D1 TaxID=3046202 RepID=UPI0024B9A236|nr:Fic family protein [Arthrobacter sp. H35-D1]MDJ0312029.1 Fic family protein [Arthrobacter sp. H35-D1]
MPDKYTYPGTEILINIPGILDQHQLDLAEQDLAGIVMAQLREYPIAGVFDFPHLQAIHRRLMGRLYSWAGEIRTTDTQAMGTGVAHCRPEFIEAFAGEVFAGIAADNFLLHLDHHEFAARLAHHWGELTSLHPFRDGNTRSQSAFLDQLATAAGWEIHWSKLDLDAVKEARVIAISRSAEPLCQLLSPAITARHRRNQE